MKKKVLIVSAGLIALLLLGFLSIYIWIDVDVKMNIETAKEMYPGNAEEALISYLLDTSNSAKDRSGKAVWTLGQIQSKKALPVLTGLYKNDPVGHTCRGKHDSVLCQYEIFKAIKAIEADSWPLHSRLNK